jgi:cysteine synthase A
MTPLIDASAILDDLWLKIEFENPSLSIKHRAIPQRIFDLFDEGAINRETNVVILTAGSAGISAAYAACKLGCKAILLVQQGISNGIVNYAKHLGADVQECVHDDLEDALERYRNDDNSYVIEQLTDTSLISYYKPIGLELLKQNHCLSAVVVGAGTTASLMGISSTIRECGIKIFAVEPEESAVLSGNKWSPHNIQGLAPPLPTRLFDSQQIDGVLTVTEEDAWHEASTALRLLGQPIGSSSGAVISAAKKLREDGHTGDIAGICAAHVMTCL